MVKPVVPNQDILSSRPRRSSVDHILAISYLVSSAPIAYLYTSSRLVGILDGLLVRIKRSSPTSRLLSWPKIWVFQVSSQGSSLVRSSRVENLVVSDPFCYLAMYFRDRGPMGSSLIGAEVSGRASE